MSGAAGLGRPMLRCGRNCAWGVFWEYRAYACVCVVWKECASAQGGEMVIVVEERKVLRQNFAA